MSSTEGIPEGWELVKIGTPVFNVDWIVDPSGNPRLCDFDSTYLNRVIVRKIELPKQYRAFANAAEFKPHRDRWVRRIANGGAFLVSDYSEEGFCYDELSPISWGELFIMGYVFDDDGSPFGVEVAE